MKKNLISVIILALVLSNLILTALLVFTILPETKKANELITAVCKSIDLDLNSGQSTGLTDLPIDQIATYSVNSGESITTNLKSTDNSTHYAVLKVSLSLNNKSENFTKYSPEVLAEKDNIITDDVIQVISSYSIDEFNNNTTEIKERILSDMQSMFGGDYVVGVNFYSITSE